MHIPDVWEAGQSLPVQVVVKNTGDTIWKARVKDRKHPVGEVHLAVADWQELASGNSFKESQPQLLLSRGFLPYDVSPGDEVKIRTHIRTPEQPGEYLIHFDLVSELIQWFSQQESQQFTKKLILK